MSNKHLKLFIVCGFTALLFPSAARAETILYYFPGATSNDLFGGAVDGLGDINGDGVADMIVGGHNAGIGGSAVVYSGQTGLVLYSYASSQSNGDFGLEVAALGDVNMDGTPDFAVGAPGEFGNSVNSGRVHVFSGIDGSLLRVFSGSAAGDVFGSSIAGLKDVNGDGHDEILIGAPGVDIGGNGIGATLLYSGSDGQLLHTWFGVAPGDHFGSAVGVIDDVNSDGVQDILVGAPDGAGSFGLVRLISGADKTTIMSVSSTAGGGWFGRSLAGVSDLNGNGVPDFLVGDPDDNTIADQGGRVFAFDGSTGAIIHDIRADGEDQHLGTAVVGIGDFDFDGVEDFAASSYDHSQTKHSDQGSVRVFSGFDGSLLATYWGNSVGDYLGAVAAVGDINGDGAPDLLVGATGDDPGGSMSGAAWVISGSDCSLVETYCQTAPNSTGAGAVIGFLGQPSVSTNDFRLTCASVPSGSIGLFLYGANEGFIPFGNGYRCTAGQVFRLGVIYAQGTSFTQALDVTTPPTPTAQIDVGSQWHFQCIYRDVTDTPSLFNLSNGLRVTFCL